MKLHPFEQDIFNEYFPDNPLTEKDAEKMMKKSKTGIGLKAKPITQDQVITEISNLTYIHKDDVKEVLKTFEMIAKREVIVRGTFRWNGLFSITSHMVTGRQHYNRDAQALLQYPRQPALSIKLSPKLKTMYKQLRKQELISYNHLNPDSWWDSYIIQPMDEATYRKIKDEDKRRKMRM